MTYRNRFTSLLLVACAVGSASAAPVGPAIAGSFWENGASRAYFELHLNSGKTQEVHVFGHRTLAISQPDSGNPVLTLLGPDGAVLLQQSLGGNLATSFRVAVCGATVELGGPATLQSAPACESGTHL